MMIHLLNDPDYILNRALELAKAHSNTTVTSAVCDIVSAIREIDTIVKESQSVNEGEG